MPHISPPSTSGLSGSTDNGYAARRFVFRDDWMYGNSVYYELSDGQPAVFGDYTTEWSSGTPRMVPMHGSQRLGLMCLYTGEASDGQMRVRTAAMGAFDSRKYSAIWFEAVVAFEAVSSASQEYRAEIGLVGNAWAIPNVRGFGHFFRYERATGGHKWIAVNRNDDEETAVILDGSTQNGIETVDGGTIDGYSLPSYGFFRLKVVAHADSEGVGSYARFYVNDVLCAQIDTNMVTHSLAGSVEILKTAGTTSRFLALDYTELGYELREAREP